MKLASVILDIPTQALDTPYTYLVPDVSEPNTQALQAGLPGTKGVCDPLGAAMQTSAYPVQVGCAVLVPLGGRRAVGLVIRVWEVSGPCDVQWPTGVDASKLKPILRVVSRSYFDEKAAACALWLSETYIAPLSSCVRLFIPPGAVPRMVRTKQNYWKLEEPSVGEVDDRWVVKGPEFGNFRPRANAVKQIDVLRALAAGDLRVAELSAQLGSVSSTLNALQKHGAITVEHRRRLRGIEVSLTDVDDVAKLSNFTPSAKPQLTPGQTKALSLIDQAIRARSGEVVLVDGVTGSGKTEVYLQAIEHVVNQGQTACVIVPEISLTPQTVGRFRGRFGNKVAVMHSRMSAGERYDQWDFIRCGQARVVVGARSALFTPMQNLGIVVIDEEHEGSYKQDQAPRYTTRDVAAWMVRQVGATLVLGSATPSIEALFNCKNNPHWHYVRLPERANGKPMPQVEIIDMAAEFSGGARSMFSHKLTAALQTELAAGHKAVLLLNQRGFAKFLLCRDCGFVPKCPNCDTSLTYHEHGNYLVCHHCGHRRLAPARCPKCNSPYLRKFGAGTQRVEDELRVLLDAMPGVGPDVPIVRMDADSTSKKGAHQQLLGQFAAAHAAVLLGTQMIAKGLDFSDVTLVGVINADTQLQLPDFRAHERTFDLIEQVAGRAGRAQLDGRVLVQTYESDAAPIRAAATYNRDLFLQEELVKREMLGYPPYVRMANVLTWGNSEHNVRKVASLIHDDLDVMIKLNKLQGWQVLPAVPCVLAKLRGSFRYHVLIKCPPEANISQVLLGYFRKRKADKLVHVAVDVDPEDLL